MIRYNLICKKCQNSFDSWFASSVEYERLKKMKQVNCIICNSLKVEKNLMSTSILNSKKEQELIKKDTKQKKIRNKIKEYQNFIKKNFEYVGDNFSYYARSIHYNGKNKERNIYGNASIEEINQLEEEGIKTEMIPWVNNKEN